MKNKSWAVAMFVMMSLAIYAGIGLVFFLNNNESRFNAADKTAEEAVYSVSFVDDYGGASISTVSVKAGQTVSRPEDPTLSGFEFLGWFIDSECQEIYDFTTPVTKNLVLYAGWNAIYHQVTFETGIGEAMEPQKVIEGTRAKEVAPQWSGCEFLGWYLDEDLTQAFSFKTAINADVKLYAKWALDFQLTDDGAAYTVVKYNGAAENVMIPAAYYGKPVIGIGRCAFRKCANIQTIQIPDGVLTIARWAFEKCTNLQDVVIPASVIRIDTGAFYDCENLTSVIILGNPAMDEDAFHGCPYGESSANE